MLNFPLASQVKQVSMQLSLDFIIPYVGPINRLETLVFGPNIRHSTEKLEAERYYAKLLVNDHKGKIVDANNKSYYKYNIDDEEYWEIPFEKLLYKPRDDQLEKKDRKNRRSSWSMNFFDEENTVIDIARDNKSDMIIFEKQSVKWVTTYTRENGDRLVVEEWSVKEFPELSIADSLNRSLDKYLGKPDSLIIPFGKGFSNLILNRNPGLHGKIPGKIIKANITSYENNEDDPNFTMKMDLIRLDVENFDENQFGIPNNFKEVKK